MKQTLENLIKELHLLEEAEKIEAQFLKIATHLMNELCINASGIKYRIVECEFYYNDGKKHNDPFLYNADDNKKLYGKDQQKYMLHWFFHQSGMDLTLGNGNHIRGGVLISPPIACCDVSVRTTGIRNLEEAKVLRSQGRFFNGVQNPSISLVPGVF